MMKKDKKNMKLNTPDMIMEVVDNLADQVCLDNDNIVRWCIDQNDLIMFLIELLVAYYKNTV